MKARWGIMGTGSIAAAMYTAITAESGDVVAVSSADPDRARAFATERDIPRSYGDHHGLLADGDLDVVHVATTNDRHHGDVLAAVEAGVAVLVEKPFTLDLAQAEEVVAAARRSGVFVMEAMWMRFQPAFRELERRLAAGQIGEPRLLTADFGLSVAVDPVGRRHSLALGGGSLLDLGVYPLTLAVSVLDEPTDIRVLGELADTGVDLQLAVAMRHPTGLSSWVSSMVADTGVEATVAGTEGSLRLHAPFHHSSRLTRRRREDVLDEREIVGADLGYRHQIREVHRCLTERLTESPRMPLELSLTVMRGMDVIRSQAGVHYPGAEPSG